jgi:hypothetical protein
MYVASTKHPWPCLVFVFALLLGYEAAMVYEASQGAIPLRSGLDAWLGSYCQQMGWTLEYLPSIFLALICLSWAVIKWDRSPPESLTTLVGMFLESMLFALALWGLGMFVTAQLHHLGIPVETRSMKAIALMGSGIFEEVLFRLVGFGLIFWLLKLVAQERTAMILAVLLSSLAFAGAHHLGPFGEGWQWKVFAFRSLAGGCFSVLFYYRGLGIAVGTHSAYNLFIGLMN